MNEWTAYQIDMSNGAELTRVRHITHVEIARRVIADNEITAGLIYDESKLNSSRTCVSWMSPNTWFQGSMYGTVQFTFDWDSLIAGRRLYWVEHITKYSPPAYRFLVTDRRLGSSDFVLPYDPRHDDGPIREQGGKWYWRNDHTCELMIDSSISLDQCTGFDFINHHGQYCRLHPRSLCPDQTVSIESTAARVLASILAGRQRSLDHVLRQPASPYPLSEAIDCGVRGLLESMESAPFRLEWMNPWAAVAVSTGLAELASFGSEPSMPTSLAIMRGVLSLYGEDRDEEARELIGAAGTFANAKLALESIVGEHFGIEYSRP
jgi:hypothetical protein